VFLNVQKHFLFYRTVQFEINPTNLGQRNNLRDFIFKHII